MSENGFSQYACDYMAFFEDYVFFSAKAMCYDVSVIMCENELGLSVVRVGHRVPSAGFCLSLYSLHVLNRDINTIQQKATCDCVFITGEF